MAKENLDPLAMNLDLTKVDTSYTALITGVYPVVIDNAEVVESKATPGNYNLQLTLKTLEPATSTKGQAANKTDDVKPGYTVKNWIPLQQSPNPDAPDFKEGLATLLDAAFNITDPSDRPPFNAKTIQGLKGQKCLVKLAYVDDETYGPSNNVKRLLPLK